MLKHIVMWEFKDFAEGNEKQENMLKAKKLLESLNGKIENMIHLEVVINIINNSIPCDVVLYSEFKDKNALEEYQIHPLHKEVAEFIGKVRSNRTVLDYEI
jgi:hypothetical protein